MSPSTLLALFFSPNHALGDPKIADFKSAPHLPEPSGRLWKPSLETGAGPFCSGAGSAGPGPGPPSLAPEPRRAPGRGPEAKKARPISAPSGPRAPAPCGSGVKDCGPGPEGAREFRIRSQRLRFRGTPPPRRAGEQPRQLLSKPFGSIRRDIRKPGRRGAPGTGRGASNRGGEGGGGAATGAVGKGPVETLSLPAEPSAEGKEE